MVAGLGSLWFALLAGCLAMVSAGHAQTVAQPISTAPGSSSGSPTGLAAASPPIRWLLLDFVPYHVIDGPKQGTGLRDQYLSALSKRLPEYQHQLEISSTERIFQAMQAGQPVCTLSLLKVPEREAYTRFASEPYFVQLPPVLIARRAYAPPGGWKKRPGGDVSLADLLRSGEVKVGTLPKRRYGQALDDILKQSRAAHPDQVLDFGEYGLLSGLLHTLSRKRFDVTLGYAIEVEQLRKTQTSPADFQFVALAEAPALIPTYVACSQTAWGRQVIQAIDRVTGMEAEKSRLREQYESMLPAEELQIYRARMAAVTAGPVSSPSNVASESKAGAREGVR